MKRIRYEPRPDKVFAGCKDCDYLITRMSLPPSIQFRCGYEGFAEGFGFLGGPGIERLLGDDETICSIPEWCPLEEA